MFVIPLVRLVNGEIVGELGVLCILCLYFDGFSCELSLLFEMEVKKLSLCSSNFWICI